MPGLHRTGRAARHRAGAGIIFGNQTNSPQSRATRRHIFADNMTWQHGTHRFKFGGEWEYLKGTGTYTLDVPADMKLFSPQEVRQLNPPIPPLLPPPSTPPPPCSTLPLQPPA